MGLVERCNELIRQINAILADPIWDWEYVNELVHEARTTYDDSRAMLICLQSTWSADVIEDYNFKLDDLLWDIKRLKD